MSSPSLSLMATMDSLTHDIPLRVASSKRPASTSTSSRRRRETRTARNERYAIWTLTDLYNSIFLCLVLPAFSFVSIQISNFPHL